MATTRWWNCRGARTGGALVASLLALTLGPTAAATGARGGSSGGSGSAATDRPVGITDDTITVGYTQIDFDRLRNELNVDLSFQDGERALDALVDELNERGGINGREVRTLVGKYLPAGAASAEELCIRFTEDEPVFVVLGGFSGPGATDVNSCITARHGTALVGGSWTDAQRRDAVAPWLSVEMTTARRAAGFAKQLGKRGMLDDIDKIAIINAGIENEPFLPDVERALDKAGAEVVLSASISGGDAEVRTLLERAIAEGATAIFFTGMNPTVYPAFGEHPELQYFFADGTTTEASLRDFFSNGGELDVISNGSFPLAYRDDPLMAECIDIVEERTDIVVKDPNTLKDDEPNWSEAVSRACQHLRLFEKVATAAGPQLSNETFLEAAEKVGEVQLPGVSEGSLGPGKYDVRDVSSIVRWRDAARSGEGGWVPIGKPYVVS